jgi:hypothetical protein
MNKLNLNRLAATHRKQMKTKIQYIQNINLEGEKY